jgi:ATP-dependent RNA helicase DHX8/PRP22
MRSSIVWYASDAMSSGALQSPGECYRLYTEQDYQQLRESTVPEIKRCNLASVVLQMKAIGIDDILGFDFMDAPSPDALRRALETLLTLEALDSNGKLTTVGKQMAELPLEPMYAKALIVSRVCPLPTVVW